MQYQLQPNWCCHRPCSTAAQAPPHILSRCYQENLDRILQAIDQEYAQRPSIGLTSRSLEFVLSDRGYGRQIDALPGKSACQLRDLRKLYKDCGVPEEMVRMVTTEDTWLPENLATMTDKRRAGAMSPPVKALFIILTGNRCAICGRRLLLW
jgi:hypothetical protein